MTSSISKQLSLAAAAVKLTLYQNKIAKYRGKCSRHLNVADNTKEDFQQPGGEVAFTKDFQLESGLHLMFCVT